MPRSREEDARRREERESKVTRSFDGINALLARAQRFGGGDNGTVDAPAPIASESPSLPPVASPSGAQMVAATAAPTKTAAATVSQPRSGVRVTRRSRISGFGFVGRALDRMLDRVVTVFNPQQRGPMVYRKTGESSGRIYHVEFRIDGNTTFPPQQVISVTCKGSRGAAHQAAQIEVRVDGTMCIAAPVWATTPAPDYIRAVEEWATQFGLTLEWADTSVRDVPTVTISSEGARALIDSLAQKFWGAIGPKIFIRPKLRRREGYMSGKIFGLVLSQTDDKKIGVPAVQIATYARYGTPTADDPEALRMAQWVVTIHEGTVICLPYVESRTRKFREHDRGALMAWIEEFLGIAREKVRWQESDIRRDRRYERPARTAEA